MTLEQRTPEVRMTTEGHVCVISLDNTAKKNAITPELMDQLSKHLTTFENDDSLWVAILCHGLNNTLSVLTPAYRVETSGPELDLAVGGLLATGAALLGFVAWRRGPRPRGEPTLPGVR